jgi:cytochrome bd ubiquinol oxidase subunit I
MNPVTLSQWQFGVTTVYHFFFVPLTIGLAVLVAIMETIYARSGNEVYLRMTKFWGKLFLVNFAVGVVTGLVLEFQFGMNWAEYSRFVGDIFGVPLAIEALLAFFLESTFIGIWLFGWDRLSRGWHAFVMWMVAFGSTISALWILVANSFMQAPVGYAIENGRAVMTNFAELVFNPYAWLQYSHTIFSAFTTAAFFVMGISAYHLLRKSGDDHFQKSFRIANIFGILSIFMVILIGHSQAQRMVQVQPMKMAAAEALWESEDPASFSLFTVGNERTREDVFAIRIPRLLSLLAYNRLDGEVRGIRDLQAEYEAQYGPGNYVPSVITAYWTFRIMVGAGLAMLALAAYSLWSTMQHRPLHKLRFFVIFLPAILLPYLANISGWLLTEMGRQPWIVVGLMKTADAVSPNLTAGMVLTTLIGFILIYGLLMAVDVYLLAKFARAGIDYPAEEDIAVVPGPTVDVTSHNAGD